MGITTIEIIIIIGNGRHVTYNKYSLIDSRRIVIILYKEYALLISRGWWTCTS